MVDAKICDRCGDYYGANEETDDDSSSQELPVSTTPDDGRQLYITANPSTTVTVTDDELNGPDAIAAAIRSTRSTTKRSSVETKDLCPDCYEAFLDYWNDGGDA